MISYQLVCDLGDRFEAWFRGSEDYEKQVMAGLIVCPECGSSEIGKALMAPAVRTSRQRHAMAAEADQTGGDGGNTVRLTAGPDPSVAKALEIVRKISKHVRDNSDDVGRSFAEEARKIHYREVEPRNIVGEATPAEAKALVDEGIEFHPLPILPEEQN